jgi:hypothetical protein
MNSKRHAPLTLMMMIIFIASSLSFGQTSPKTAPERKAPRPPTAPTTPIPPTITPTLAPSKAPTPAVQPTPSTLPSAAPTPSPQESPVPDDEDDDNQIIPAPTLLSYGEVKDNFGRRIADTYVVVQVTIKNPDIQHQFLLQDLRVVFDPNECDSAKEFYEHFDVQACRDQYNKYLKYPIAYAPISQSSLQAVAGIGQNQNPRNVLFRSLDFLATMGGALTGFDFIGRDGKAGLAVFNGTFLTSSKALLPDLTVGQLTQLTEQSYKPNTLVESKDTKTYCVFIPTNQLFSKETWKLYKQKTRDGSAEALEMRKFLQLVLTVTASGIHIQQADNDTGNSVTRGGAARPTPTPTPTPAATSTQPTP